MLKSIKMVTKFLKKEKIARLIRVGDKDVQSRNIGQMLIKGHKSEDIASRLMSFIQRTKNSTLSKVDQ
jgi:hypothetical protein